MLVLSNAAGVVFLLQLICSLHTSELIKCVRNFASCDAVQTFGDVFVNTCCLQGRVVETGTHSSLLAKGGKYATMWSRQANVDDSSAIGLLEDHEHSKKE